MEEHDSVSSTKNEEVTEEQKELVELNVEKSEEDSINYKREGNNLFKLGEFEKAIEQYTHAISSAPIENEKHLSVCFCNRAACHHNLEDFEDVIADCKSALEFDENYSKAYYRQGLAYESLEKYDLAFGAMSKAVECFDGVVPSHLVQKKALLETQMKEQQEKMKEEVLSKLKNVGNTILGKFGLSLDNFQMVKDEKSGGYSVNFQQNK
eukprot:TRINITY_DN775867_c0_g1_i1.p1 TRINITY_DN775867_c0_g1~~TRINITY_DN775867_c0_g1_i1.p1  ORF type:complete len:209 (-),score=49.59 TRINITY_DN775867_c0_g1_i1:141-767(-)